MGKKSKRNRPPRSEEATTEDRRAPPALRTLEEETMENLRFEDPFVEEYHIDDEDEAGEWEDVDEDVPAKPAADDELDQVMQSWNPLTGPALAAGEALEMDASAYKMHHALTPEWPALSFDFVRDDLGEARTRFPHTLTVAVGTQAADGPQHNSLTVLQISDLAKMAVETEDDILGEEYNPDGPDDDDEDDDDDDDDEMEPIMEHYSIPHYGGVNRVRVMPQRPDIVATWSDAGAIHLYNIASIRQRFSAGRGAGKLSDGIPTQPFFSHTAQTEGYALDWSTVQSGSLVSADCDGAIQLWSPRPDGVFAVTPFYTVAQQQTRSVEDLQWSPTEATVFGTAEGQGYVRIFDTRAANKAMLTHQIHPNIDVNVLSWNKLVNNLLATGGDDGTLAVWDLRQFQASTPSPLARFTPHKTPITSVEWHPTDESMLATSDDVGTYIYDLSVEEDDETRATSASDVPPQLLFVHCGSEQFKEVHWHPQISSCLMTTALTGFSIFIPSNL